MVRHHILAFILAGGKGSRLEVLTEQRAKPAMPFAGTYRLIDFALSNCMHSRLSDVWVVEQYRLHSLNEHLANGRPWDLDRTYGGLQVLPPYESRGDQGAEGGFAEGTADAVYRNRHLIREFSPDLLVVLSADHVYKLDYSRVVERHLTRRAAVTMVTAQVPREEAHRGQGRPGRRVRL
jgi:glucose-1-phosphate adenylyltransferase